MCFPPGQHQYGGAPYKLEAREFNDGGVQLTDNWMSLVVKFAKTERVFLSCIRGKNQRKGGENRLTLR